MTTRERFALLRAVARERDPRPYDGMFRRSAHERPREVRSRAETAAGRERAWARWRVELREAAE